MDAVTLERELRTLGKGDALRDPRLPARLRRLGLIREAFGIDDGDSPARIRHKVEAGVTAALADVDDPELRTMLLGALALLPGSARHRNLLARYEWLAGDLGWVTRTVRRRVADAYVLVAQRLADQPPPPPAEDDESYVVQRFVATMRLDTPSPQLTERRLIRAAAPKLSHLTVRLTVPRATGGGPSEVHAQVDCGGVLVERVRKSDQHFVFTIDPPRVLQGGDEHEFAVTYTIPAGQPMQPHYVFQPLTPCLWFGLTIHFDPTRPPPQVWLFDGVMLRDIDDEDPAAQRVLVGDDAILSHHFTNLRQGFTYGVRWS